MVSTLLQLMAVLVSISFRKEGVPAWLNAFRISGAFLAVALLSITSGFSGWLIALETVAVISITLLLERSKTSGSAKVLFNLLSQLLIVFCALLLLNSGDWIQSIKQWNARYEFDDHSLKVALGYAFCLSPTNALIQFALDRLGKNIASKEGDEQGRNAGRYIGSIERCIALTLVMNNQYEAIGWLIAAKSLIRIREDQKDAEYIILGNLMSFGVAIATGTIIG